MQENFEKNSVLILKAQEQNEHTESNEYCKVLELNGFKVQQCTPIVFHYKNLEILKEKLENSKDYRGLILASPRCVQAIQKIYENEPNCLQNWYELENYCVGPKTSKLASNLLHLQCNGGEAGNLENLYTLITLRNESLLNCDNNSSSRKPFLVPHGNLKDSKRQSENFLEENLLVYDTVPNPNLYTEIEKLTENFKKLPEIVVFFSPSGVRCFHTEILVKITEFQTVKKIAIGPTTRSELEKFGYMVNGTATEPNPYQLSAVITSQLTD